MILIPRWGMTFESLVLLTMAEVHLANNLRTAPDTYTPIKVVASPFTMISAVKRSIGFTIGFHNHEAGPFLALLLVKSAY